MLKPSSNVSECKPLGVDADAANVTITRGLNFPTSTFSETGGLKQVGYTVSLTSKPAGPYTCPLSVSIPDPYILSRFGHGNHRIHLTKIAHVKPDSGRV